MTTRPTPLTRRAFALGAVGGGLGALLPGTALRAVAAEQPWAERARTSYLALREHLHLPGPGLYREGLTVPEGGNQYSFVWPLREATAASQDVSLLPGGPRDAEVADHFRALELYHEESSGSYASYPPEPVGGGGDSFYDDNTVIGLEQVRRYRLHGEERMLQRAVRAFDFVTRAWDEESTGARAGGMHWVDADWNPYQGGTNVTALAAELAAHLYEQTGEERYLEWAQRCYRWVRRVLRRGPGRYANGLLLDGTSEEALWTYNSGAMIGAATLLHRVTGEREWQRRAQLDAETALSYWTAEDRLRDQPVVFNAIFLANLLLFASTRPSWAGEVLAPFADYADRLWEENRDEDTGLFTFQASGGGAPDPAQAPQTLHQSGVVQIQALLAWPPERYADAT